MPKIGNKTKGFASKPFAEGGVIQEGGTIDPVSGNDVPPGAMAEEVRDDIPAQLSEGEFVIPADVVRYIGLENLMKLRDKAKMGLRKMEEIGQMGNAEEVPDAEALHGSDDMDDDTFSSEIDSIMNDGGEQEYAAGGDVRKYAPGGYVGGAENEQLYRDAPIKGFEMVPMTNDAGQTIYIPFINGVAQLNVPAGYKVKTANEAVTTPVAPVDGGGGGGGGTGGDGGGGGGGTSSGPGFTIGEDGFAVANTTNSTVASVIGSIVSAITGIPALGMIGKTVSTQSNAANAAATAAFNVAVSDTTAAANTEGLTSPTATTGPTGTGGAAASAASTAAAAAAAAGMSDAAIGAASQAAADATVAGLSAAQAAEQGNAAAVSVTIGENNAAAAESAPSVSAPAGGTVGPGGVAPGGGEAPSVGDTAPSGDAAPSGGDGAAGTGASSSGDGTGSGGDGPGSTLAKGGFVFKRKPKKTVVKNKGLASRK